MGTKKLEIDIEGMSCASCQVNIQKSLSKVKGVKKAGVQLLQKKAVIEVEDSVSEKELKNAVEKVGNYKVESITYDDSPTMNHKGMNHEGHDHSSADSSEIEKWKKKMIWAWIITAPSVFILYSQRFFGLNLFSDKVTAIVLLVLAFPVVFIIGWGTIKGAFKGLRNFYFNMDLLIALGTMIAYSTGILQFFLPIKDYAAVSGMIMAIFITGKFIESTARGRAGREIQKLLELGAKRARVLRDNLEVEIDISQIKVGDVMIIKPGEKVPTDGMVIKGESFVDESMVTGESLPTEKIKGANVIGATINQDGILYVKVTKIGKDTFLSGVIKLVQEAQGSKIPIQAFADKVISVFVPSILVIVLLTFLGWMYFSGNFSSALVAAISVLVIACPCALGLATPTAILVGTGMGAKKGILIRKGEAIQTMKEVKIILLDKTGTITKGHPEVVFVHTETNEKHFWEVVASLEKLSGHPLSRAIVEKANLKKYLQVKNFKILRGKGIEGKIGSNEIIIGNRDLMEDKKISFEDYEEKIISQEKKGQTVMIVSERGKILGLIGVADAIKGDSIEAIKELKEKGLEVVMITGDNKRTALVIAKQVGIEKVIANVLPEGKAKAVEEIQKKDFVAFVGDGINDAPALKQSNVGIALGTGTDIAIESGDIVLTNGSLKGTVQAINLSKKTFSKIKQNLFWAFLYNTVAIPIAISGVLSPIIAELAMALSSVSVVANANLLRRAKI